MTDFANELEQQSIDAALALNAKTYSDPDFAKLEAKAIFENQWQLVAHVSQFSNTGDQVVVKIGNTPIVIVKNQFNELKAMHNVCRHRAGPVATECGNSKVLRCKYHGWTYDLNGQLKSAPEMESTKNFHICKHKLPSAFIDIWQGFVFVSINQPTVDLKTIFHGIEEQILPIDLAVMSFSHRDEYVIDCNWKVYVDNYLEGYHLPHVHPGLSKLLDYRQYDTKLYQWYSYQFSPLSGAEENRGDIFYGEGSAHYYCIFPNLMLNILPGRLQTNLVIPIGYNKTKIIFDYYYSDLCSKKTQELIRNDREFSDEVQQEDITICEQVQEGLNSESYQAGPLCMKRETGVLHFQNLIRQTINDFNALKRKNNV